MRSRAVVLHPELPGPYSDVRSVVAAPRVPRTVSHGDLLPASDCFLHVSTECKITSSLLGLVIMTKSKMIRVGGTRYKKPNRACRMQGLIAEYILLIRA